MNHNNNTLIFLRHAETLRQKDISVSQWNLTAAGVAASQNLADSGVFDDVDIIIASSETKAVQTAQPIANKLGKEILQVEELGELNRDKGTLMSKQAYDDLKQRILQDLNYTEQGWETAGHALNRFSKAIEKIDKKHKNKKILIVSHGTVMSLYFAKLQGYIQNFNGNVLWKRWKALDFCSWGMVKDGEVVRDVVETEKARV